MPEKSVLIRFEINDPIRPDENYYGLGEITLHEMLCKAIHEGSEEALFLLTDNVTNIEEVKEK